MIISLNMSPDIILIGGTGNSWESVLWCSIPLCIPCGCLVTIITHCCGACDDTVKPPNKGHFGTSHFCPLYIGRLSSFRGH